MAAAKVAQGVRGAVISSTTSGTFQPVSHRQIAVVQPFDHQIFAETSGRQWQAECLPHNPASRCPRDRGPDQVPPWCLRFSTASPTIRRDPPARTGAGSLKKPVRVLLPGNVRLLPSVILRIFMGYVSQMIPSLEDMGRSSRMAKRVTGPEIRKTHPVLAKVPGLAPARPGGRHCT